MSTAEGSKPAPVFVVSGGEGSSGEQLARTVLAQFPDVDVPVVIVPHVRTSEDLEHALDQTLAQGGMVVHTLVDEHLRVLMERRAHERGIAAIDLMGGLLMHLSGVLGRPPSGRPGLYRQQREAYFKRVDAIAFTVAHDDGQRIDELPLAQIVLVGPSRCGKTPLSIYLSVSGWRVANVPLIPEMEPPAVLRQMDPRRVVGLTIEPGQLVIHRQWRRQSLGIPDSVPYVNAERIYEEVAAARAFCRREGFGLVNVTDKPIEASAEEVIALVTRRLRSAGGRPSG